MADQGAAVIALTTSTVRREISLPLPVVTWAAVSRVAWEGQGAQVAGQARTASSVESIMAGKTRSCKGFRKVWPYAACGVVWCGRVLDDRGGATAGRWWTDAGPPWLGAARVPERQSAPGGRPHLR